MARQGRCSGPTGRAASTPTATVAVPAASGAAATDADSGPVVWTSGRAATAYHRVRPASTWVSAYGGCGTASTVSPPWWSRGAYGPSGASARWTR